jgi:uncharacterized membrane protein YhaH (DUF805 family)
MNIVGLFDFTGRASRADFGLIVLWCFGLYLVPAVFVGMGFGLSPGAMMNSYYVMTQFLGLLWLLFELVLAVVVLAASARRMHDQNDSAWRLLFYFLPFIGWLILIILFLTPGDKGENRFGRDPLAPPGPKGDLKDIFS